MRHLIPSPKAPTPTETALIVPVPAAEAVVADHRADLDVAASRGVPAHVAILYPFIDPALTRDPDVLTAIEAAVGTVSVFDCVFRRTAWFGEDVLWLEPDPAQPFLDLTAAVWSAFPDFPPYGGAYGDPVPHLTIAERSLGDLTALQQAEKQVERLLPVHAQIDRVLLIAGARARQSWRVLHELALAPEA